MTFDFAAIDTETLRRETRERASRVWGVTEPVWTAMEWALVAFLKMMLAAAVVVAFSVFIHPVALVLLIGMWPLAETWWAMHSLWRQNLAKCRAFTAEMDARTAELRRRKS